MNTPPELTMLFYTAFDGGETTVVWDSEEMYQQIKKFLEDMGLYVSETLSGGARTKPAFVYVKNEHQIDAMCEYSRTLKEKAKT
jgi:hypothetical protein